MMRKASERRDHAKRETEAKAHERKGEMDYMRKERKDKMDERKGEMRHKDMAKMGDREVMDAKKGPLKRAEDMKTRMAEAKKPEHKGTFMKDGGMDREPRAEPDVKVWKRGDAETIKKGAPDAKPMSDGTHGMDFKTGMARERKGMRGEMPTVDMKMEEGAKHVYVHHVHHHIGSKEKK